MLPALAVVALAGCRADPDIPPPSDAQTKARPAEAPQPPAAAPAAPEVAPRGYAGPLPPLPNVPYPPARPLEVTRAVYAFAARSPEVLRYVPCFCGCEHHGHQGNDDCFVASRGADGRPQWEMHGYV